MFVIGTKHLGLVYQGGKQRTLQLTAFSDSDWGGELAEGIYLWEAHPAQWMCHRLGFQATTHVCKELCRSRIRRRGVYGADRRLLEATS